MSLSPPVTEGGRSLAEAFVASLSRRDFSWLQELFHPRIRFRALVPPGVREAGDAAGAVGHLRRWFEDADAFVVLASTVGRVGPRLHVSYRIRLREEGVWSIVEQQAYLDGKEGRIHALDLLCSGFIPEPDRTDGSHS